MAISLKNIKSLVKKKQEGSNSLVISENNSSNFKTEEETKNDYVKKFCDLMNKDVTKKNIEEYLVPGTNKAYYLSDYISKDQEAKLLDCIFNLDLERWFNMKSGRQLKMYGGEVKQEGGLSN